MSPQRLADAANISPYPFVVRQIPNPPPENGDRASRPVKGKKRQRQRAERNNPRQDEEPRFNTGPKRPGNHGARRGFRMPGRAYPEDRNGIPDYPPPSFQEAINTPAVSVCSSTTSLVLAQPSPPLVIPDCIPEDVPSSSTPPTTDRPEIDPLTESDNASESDESELVIINRNEVPVCSTDLPRGPALEERIKKDWMNRRGVEFPITSSSDPSKSSDQLSRGRKPGRPVLLIDPNVANNTYMEEISPVSSPKRRFLSLSPIRTILPSKAATLNDRSMSAHPSPISSASPYSGSRNFFRSTTSLAAASFLRLPGLSLPAPAKKESLSRRLFSHKGKERVKEPEILESLEEHWEILDSAKEMDKATAPVVSEHPQSLMSIVESFSPTASTTTLAKNSPTRSTFSHRASPDRLRMTQANTSVQSIARDPTPLTSPSVVSFREKGQVTPFIERPLNRRSINLSPTILEGPETLTSSSTMTPILPSTPLTPSTRSEAVASPSTANRRTAATPVLRVNVINRPAGVPAEEEHQRALETPLPMTPVYHNYFECHTSLPVNHIKQNLPSRHTTTASGNLVENPISASTVDPTPPGTCGASVQTNTRPVHHSSPSFSIAVYPSHPSGLPTQVSLMKTTASVEEPMTPTTRHHYVGRPLPRPPAASNPTSTQSRAVMVDSVYSSPSGSSAGHSSEADRSNCPTGMLIDLEDTSLDSYPLSPTETLRSRSDESEFHTQLYPPIMSAGASSIDLSQEPPGPDFSFTSTSMQATSTPIRPFAPSTRRGNAPLMHHHVHQPQPQRQQPLGYSNLTDLDLLVSRLSDEGEVNGLNYEVSSGRHRQGWKERDLTDNSYASHVQTPDPASGVRHYWTRDPEPSSSRTAYGSNNTPGPFGSNPTGAYPYANYHVQYAPIDASQRQRQYPAHRAY